MSFRWAAGLLPHRLRHPPHVEGVFGRRAIAPGVWHVERIEDAVGMKFDHLDPVFGAF